MIIYWLTQPSDAATTVAASSLAALGQAAWASVRLGAGGAALTMLLALPLGLLATRYNGWLIVLLERCAYLAQGAPGIVVALALISLTVHALRPLYQSTLLLLLGLRHPVPASGFGERARGAVAGADDGWRKPGARLAWAGLP